MKLDLERILKQHKYCFKCAGELEYKKDNLLICKSCGYHNYINPVPANGAILENDRGEILLVKRKVDPNKGYWDVAGGFVDFEENLEESIERELREELGTNIKGLKYLCSYPDVYMYGGVEIATLIILYVGFLHGEKMTPDDDIAGYKFFKKSKIPFGKIAFNGLKKALKDYVNDHK